jgi:LuxR family transcriptional regulator, quorum-sensing system regulator LasR
MAVLAHEQPTADLRPLAPVHRAVFPNRHDTEHNQLTTEILQLDTCSTFEQVHKALLSISARLGFDTFLYRGRFQTGGSRSVEHVESNYNPSWRQRYDAARYVQIDPTISHACSSICPLIWADHMYTSGPAKMLRDEAQQYGLVEGVTFPVHSRNGDFGMLSLSLSRSDDAARHHIRAMLTWGALLASMTHETMARIVKISSAAQSPKLTRREAEVLRWIAEGKSNWEISRLVEISEHGVSYHVRNILLKFDVGSRHRAVAQAQAYGLL